MGADLRLYAALMLVELMLRSVAVKLAHMDVDAIQFIDELYAKLFHSPFAFPCVTYLSLYFALCLIVLFPTIFLSARFK